MTEVKSTVIVIVNDESVRDTLANLFRSIGLENTVEVHRGHLMRKMKARLLPDLARMADRIAEAGIRSGAPT